MKSIFQKYRKIIFLALIALLVNSCCDCPLKESSINIKCFVREASITDFDPTRIFNPSDSAYIPSQTYSIHTFLFPNDLKSSGSLPNDERFKTLNSLSILKIPFSDKRPYYLILFDNLPLNSDQNGDILVDSVYIDNSNFLNNFAFLRIKGSIERLDQKFFNDGAQEFCDYVAQNEKEIVQKSFDLKQYGKGVVGSTQLRSFSVNDIKIFNSANQEVTEVIPSSEDIDKLLNLLSNDGIDLAVQMGDVFIYQSINKKKFAFAIVNISQGQLEPYKKRVTIMFTQIN